MKRTLTAIITALLLASCTANNNIITTEGKFHTAFDDVYGEMLYQFKSDDNTVWWLLTEDEIGFIPNFNDKYTLTYDNNGTTADNKPCDCIPEYDCECEVYDDEFISLRREGDK